MYGYLCTKFHDNISIFGSSIFWKSMTKLYVYDDSHLKNHSPLKSEYTEREHTQETIPLWKVIKWKHGKDPSPCFTNYEEREVNMTTNAFSSTRMQDGRKTGQWVPNTVNLLQWRPWKRIWVRDLTTIKSQMHKSWVWRIRSQADYLSQVRSGWDQCPASSSPAHISSPDKEALIYPTD
jgi:hypothetical protein